MTSKTVNTLCGEILLVLDYKLQMVIGRSQIQILVLGREWPYFVKEHSDLKNKYTEDDIISMLVFLVDNIFVLSLAERFSNR